MCWLLVRRSCEKSKHYMDSLSLYRLLEIIKMLKKHSISIQYIETDKDREFFAEKVQKN